MVNIPKSETVRLSAISFLRESEENSAADILNRCKLEISDTVLKDTQSSTFGVIVTLRCIARDLKQLHGGDDDFYCHPDYYSIENAVNAVFPAELSVHKFSAKALLVDPNEYPKTEILKLFEVQKSIMVAVATGDSRIQEKNDEYKSRQDTIKGMLTSIGKNDPNPFSDLWNWYGRCDLPPGPGPGWLLSVASFLMSSVVTLPAAV